jgi:hypothetical protein
MLVEGNWSVGIDPPPFKFVHHRCRACSGYDTRAGIMRVCASMYLFKNYALKDWMRFAEVYGIQLSGRQIRAGGNEGGPQGAYPDRTLPWGGRRRNHIAKHTHGDSVLAYNIKYINMV